MPPDSKARLEATQRARKRDGKTLEIVAGF